MAEKTIKLGVRQCITTAPKDYDYGWMRTLVDNIAVTKDGKPMRLVENEDDWHYKQQVMRYGSGLHLTLENDIAIADHIRYGWITLTDNPIVYYRYNFDVKEAARWPYDSPRAKRLWEIVRRLGRESKADDSNFSINADDGGYTYRLEVRGDEQKFKVIVAEVNEALAATE